jgi:hypothetical protein
LKKTHLYTIVVCLIAFLSSCEKDDSVIDQNRIYSTYALTYNSALNKTTASATFTVDEPSILNINKIKLTHPAKVRYNGKELVFIENELTYRKEFIGMVESQFSYTNYDNLEFFNSISIPDSIDMVSLPDSAALSADFSLQWVGKAVEDGEGISIFVRSLETGSSFSLSAENTAPTIFFLNGSDIESLGTGNAIIKMSRYISSPTNEAAAAGGNMLMKYEIQDTVYFY